MLLVLPFVWQTPDGWGDLAMFCGMGVLGATGHYCVAKALGYAPANIISPFQYFQLIGSVADRLVHLRRLAGCRGLGRRGGDHGGGALDRLEPDAEHAE